MYKRQSPIYNYYNYCIFQLFFCQLAFFCFLRPIPLETEFIFATILIFLKYLIPLTIPNTCVGTVPVSYTHLDVYKRQRYNSLNYIFVYICVSLNYILFSLLIIIKTFK